MGKLKLESKVSKRHTHLYLCLAKASRLLVNLADLLHSNILALESLKKQCPHFSDAVRTLVTLLIPVTHP